MGKSGREMFGISSSSSSGVMYMQFEEGEIEARPAKRRN